MVLKRHSFFILLVLKNCTFGFADYISTGNYVLQYSTDNCQTFDRQLLYFLLTVVGRMFDSSRSNYHTVKNR